MAGCKCHDETCTKYPEIFLRFEGFDSVEKSRVIVRGWDTTGSSSASDTLVFNANVDKIRAGRINVSWPYWAGRDVVVEMPYVPRTIHFSDFRYEAAYQRICPGIHQKVDVICTNPLLSYTQDGVIHQYGGDSETGLVINK
jgi:hypothetical protein